MTSDFLRHNKLLKDSDIQPVDREHIDVLGGLIEECNAQGIFGIHLGHKHFDLWEGTHLAGRLVTDDKRKYFWTRAVQDNESDPDKLCGRIFVYDSDKVLRPCEFFEGTLPDLSAVDRQLFAKFGSYLAEHHLEHSIALEYLIPKLRGRTMLELVSHEKKHILLFESEIVPPSFGKPVVTAYTHDQSGVAFGPGTRYLRPPGSTDHVIYNPDAEELIGFKEIENAIRKLEALSI
jgi:hypothetical protein